MRVDALVIGAGPAGSAAARLLAQAGWSVGLVEKAEFPRRKVCGEFISAATLPVLEACGVSDSFVAAAGPHITRVALYSGGVMVDAPLPRAGSGVGWGRALGREHLDVLLRDAAVAAGARLFQPAEIIALERREKSQIGVLQTNGDRLKIEARVVIAACGSWNAKGPFALEHQARPTDLLAFKAHFRGAALPIGLMPLLAFPGGYGGMVHSDGGRVSLSCCIRRDKLTQIRQIHGGKAADAVFRHIKASTEGVRRALRDAAYDGDLLSTGPIHPGIRPRYKNGIFFTGNIAGEAHPIIAEGISMAIQSSWLLAQRLVAAGPDAAGLGATELGAKDPGAAGDYARAWRAQFATRIHAASLFAHCALQDRSRGAMAQMVRAFPAMLTWGAAVSGKATQVIARREIAA